MSRFYNRAKIIYYHRIKPVLRSFYNLVMHGWLLRIISSSEINYRGNIEINIKIINIFPFHRDINVAVVLSPLIEYIKDQKLFGNWRVTLKNVKPCSSGYYSFIIKFPDMFFENRRIQNRIEVNELINGKYIGFIYLIPVTQGDERIVADRMFKLFNFNSWLKKRERLSLDKDNKTSYYFLYSKPFSKNADNYSSMWQIDNPFAHLEFFCQYAFNFIVMISRMRMLPGSTVLDIGSGSGYTTEWLSRLGYNALGYDISLETLAIGNRRLENAISSSLCGGGDKSDIDTVRPDFLNLCGDSEILPFKDGSIDYLLSIETLHHVPNYLKTIKEAARVLKSKGKMLILEPGHNHSEKMDALITMKQHGILENSLDKNKIIKEAKTYGLNVKDYMIPVNTYDITKNDNLFYKSYLFRFYGNLKDMFEKMLNTNSYMKEVIFLILEKD